MERTIRDIITDEWRDNMIYLVKNAKSRKELKTLGQVINAKEKEIEKFMEE